MDAAELENLKRSLRERKAEIESLVLSETELVENDLAVVEGEPSIDPNHPADLASSSMDIQRDLNLLEIHRLELGEINQALVRVELPNFGICETCGEAIPIKRLMFIPQTRHCIGCQEAIEAQMH